MPDYRQVCRDGTPLPFMAVAGAGKARDRVSTEQLSTLDPFHLGFWPASPRAFFCPCRTLPHGIVGAFSPFPLAMLSTILAHCFAEQHQRLRYRTALVLYVLVIGIGDIPGARADIGQYASGVVLHSFGYGVLTLILFSGIAGGMGRRALLSVLTVMAMGAIDEIIQSFLPYRRGAVSDWLVDIAAAVTVALPLYFIWPGMAAAALRRKPS